MEKNLTSGSVLKNIIYFSLPYLLSYFLQTLYGMADLFIIAQFEGVAGTTAVSIGSQVMHMITVMIVGLAMGATVNIGLDYLFMGYFHLGPVGAALGTTLSQLVTVMIALTVILRQQTGISLSKEDFKPHRPSMQKILNIGVPVALQDGFIQIAFIVITIIANRRGPDTAAAVGIVEKIISFLFLVPSSMLSTVSALCAQNIGAKKHGRASQTLRYGILIATGFGMIVSIIIQFIAGPVVSLFTTDTNVVVLGGQYLRGYIFDCVFAGIHFCFSGYFCAYGKSGFSFLHNIIAILLVRIPGVYFTSIWFPDTLFPTGIATACGALLSVIICLLVSPVIFLQSTFHFY